MSSQSSPHTSKSALPPLRMAAPASVAVSATDAAYRASHNSSDSGSRKVLLPQQIAGAALSTSTNISWGRRRGRGFATSKNYIENMNAACSPPQRVWSTPSSTANSSGGTPYYRDTADSEGFLEVVEMNRRLVLMSARCVAEFVGREPIPRHTALLGPLFDSAVPNKTNGNHWPAVDPKHTQCANPLSSSSLEPFERSRPVEHFQRTSIEESTSEIGPQGLLIGAVAPIIVKSGGSVKSNNHRCSSEFIHSAYPLSRPRRADSIGRSEPALLPSYQRLTTAKLATPVMTPPGLLTGPTAAGAGNGPKIEMPKISLENRKPSSVDFREPSRTPASFDAPLSDTDVGGTFPPVIYFYIFDMTHA